MGSIRCSERAFTNAKKRATNKWGRDHTNEDGWADQAAPKRLTPRHRRSLMRRSPRRFRKTCLVAGKACRVAHIMGGIVQGRCLNVTCQRDHSDAQSRRKKGWHKAKRAACLCGCCHVFSPYRHTRRHISCACLAGLLARGSAPFPAFPVQRQVAYRVRLTAYSRGGGFSLGRMP